MFWGYIAAAVVTLIGSLVAFKFGVNAEGKALEEIAPPLSSYDENGNETTKLPVRADVMNPFTGGRSR